MNRRSLAISSLLAAACLLAVCADSVNAQGGRGRFGRTTHQIQLATLPEVQADLKLTDEQKTKIADLNQEFDDERQAQGFGGGRGGGGGGFSEEARAARAKFNADYAAKLNEALEEPQQKRIQEVYVQVNGAGVLADEDVAAALVLTDEQKASLATALDDQRQAMRDAFQDFQDMTDEEQTAKTAELTKARDEALLALLTDEQKTQFEAMKGEALEVDLGPLRGRGGRGGFGGGRRGDRGDDGAADGAADGEADADDGA